MLTEGFLAVLVILACVAGIGLGTQHIAGPVTISHMGTSISAGAGGIHFDPGFSGRDAWLLHYSTWGGDAGLGANLAPFVTGSANMIESIGISHALAIAIMGVFVASFAATTLDSACRLQRYVIAELAGAGTMTRGVDELCRGCGYNLKGLANGAACPECGGSERQCGPQRPLSAAAGVIGNRYVATGIAVLTAAALALSDAPRVGLDQAGKGGLILWPVFGATNQLLGGLALLVVTVWLVRQKRPVWVTAVPMVFMLAMTGWAIAEMVRQFAGQEGKLHLLVVSVLMLAFEVWIVVEAVVLLGKQRGRRTRDAAAVE
jgi:carbon starvation protein